MSSYTSTQQSNNSLMMKKQPIITKKPPHNFLRRFPSNRCSARVVKYHFSSSDRKTGKQMELSQKQSSERKRKTKRKKEIPEGECVAVETEKCKKEERNT